MAFFSLPTKFILCIFMTSLVFQTTFAQLSSNFYETSCPNALSTIRTLTENAVSNEARVGASIVRLHFHDCFVQGCDASVLLDDTGSFTGEKTAGPNVNSLTEASFNLIDTIKTQLETICPGVVSCADILTVSSRDSVVALGGPSWTVPLGRRDSTTANISVANTDLPGPDSTLSELIASFEKKNLNANELVALSGAHTIGQARCTTFRSRIYNDTNIDPIFASTRRENCPSAGGDSNLAPMDPTPTSFDNAYFTDLVSQRGLFHSDQELFNNGSTDSQVSAYSSDSATFFTDFANAMIKMGNLEPLTGNSGQIRTNCRRVN